MYIHKTYYVENCSDQIEKLASTIIDHSMSRYNKHQNIPYMYVQATTAGPEMNMKATTLFAISVIQTN